METLIFDCDGVLVDSECLAEGVLLERLGQWLPDLHPEVELRQALGMTTSAILAHLEQRSRHRLPADALERIDAAIEVRLARELRPVTGVAASVSRLPLPMAIVSNSSRRRVRASLETTGLVEWLDDAPLFTAEQVERPKPDPGVYLLAASSLGSEPADCLVIEDSVSGVTAACAAGMTVIGFLGASHIEPGHDQRLLDAGAWRVMTRMDELDVLLAHWQQRPLSREVDPGD
ncbi:HAD family hydrolase [Aidingimonas lacisalsi]|uniref:HAD family hydrolase n=1 Tax=Aidingimonas lacisalsi TaxID=2604086 RepID=UPI0011D26E7A|nr:HAD-IA family hydrolase [Aidingimonas lacisalsi]